MRWIAYRLRRWPKIDGAPNRTELLRALSVMTHRPVTATWFAHQVGWKVVAARAYLDELVQHGTATKDLH
ncbi:MAG TPA: hypothetical protein VF522_19185 [Ramlibacter sp.]|uniref:hypothetical protein n=1 Tax=Ramlibacter sp. TaxID=1917967 RepID=UPI002ED13F69